MGKVLKFEHRRHAASEGAVKGEHELVLLRWRAASDTVDDALQQAIHLHGLTPAELSGLVSHRLGALLATVEDRAAVWHVCERVLLQQASLVRSDL